MQCRNGTRVRASGCSFQGGKGAYAIGKDGAGTRLLGASRLVHDPACTFSSIVGDGSERVVSAALCRVDGGAAVGTSGIAVTGPSGSWAVVFVSFPAPAMTLPFGDVWLDPSVAVPVQTGVLPLSPLGFPTPPNWTGRALAVQGALVHQGVLRPGPPLVTIVP